MGNIIRSVLITALIALYSVDSLALDFIVNSTADVPDSVSGDGMCNPVNAIPGTCTLRAAIMEANANPGNHNIIVATGDYTLSNTGTGEDDGVTGDLDIHGNITIFNGTSNRPSIGGGFNDRVFDIHRTGSLTLENIDVSNGYANTPGSIRGGAFTVAGDANDNGVLILRRSTVSSNIANQGGAIYNDGVVVIEESEFFFNAITDDHVVPEFPADGAAVLNRGVMFIERSTFHSNGVIPGGDGQFLTAEYAIHSKPGFVGANLGIRIANSTFYNNTNGIFSDGVPTEIFFSTVVNNNMLGLGFLRDIANFGDVQLTIDNTVIVGHANDCNNIPTDAPEFDVAFNVNASSDATCGFSGFNSFENIDFPFRNEAGAYGGPTTTVMPLPDSVLIDPAGSFCDGLTVDQRGIERPLDGDDVGGALCDIGAVEFNPETDIDPDPEPDPDEIFNDGFESP